MEVREIVRAPDPRTRVCKGAAQEVESAGIEWGAWGSLEDVGNVIFDEGGRFEGDRRSAD